MRSFTATHVSVTVTLDELGGFKYVLLKKTPTRELAWQVIGAIVYMKYFLQVVSRPLGPESLFRTGWQRENSPNNAAGGRGKPFLSSFFLIL